MDRKTAGLILAIVPFIAVIIALITAFSLSGDISSMVIERAPGEVITDYINGFSGENLEIFNVSGYLISEDNNSLSLMVVVNNPVGYPLIVENMSYEAEINGDTVVLDLIDPVIINPGDSGTIILSGNLSGNISEDVEPVDSALMTGVPAGVYEGENGMPDKPDPSDIKSTISVAGIKIMRTPQAQEETEQ